MCLKWKKNSFDVLLLYLCVYIFNCVYVQVASTTLDASAKIYAGRVDAIHAETYKVLTGLGRSGEKSKADEDGKLQFIC